MRPADATGDRRSGRCARGVAAIGAAIAAVAVLASLTAVPDRALAQDDDIEGGAVINLEETVVEGRIQKPEAFYILQHSSLNYEALEPKKSFLPALVESVERDPF